MRVKYFSDTDTALVEFTENPVVETREIGENIYVDLDKNGNLVSMTIEHARSNARLQEFSFQEVLTPSPDGRAEPEAALDDNSAALHCRR